ncbi:MULTISPECIES: phosphoenolpyruvate synthase [unclassified Colwellia]|uniref:phosphoenolpyruvate synthase n=1 Tax=unclassified Colwellia TaxID=196834 RepID=UPI0015F36FDD|nr:MULTISPECIES: phosphoenolpyruvate synthase [unclassified Colwellia]MBA6362611.1 phosphoenolpyruvate synthase [Colwellia sp. BRX8-8]MBA6346673.1 phosphoenolpyruvate synthase [Colwellia sp. BRX8-9]MBA6372253.1 phosphoenolpyruvate synthase [Colwellia sp. BRX8-4]MBA6379399.1 phosphoenolpyruvate synthase [Colwellia sp. BRX10-7]MBA6388600.1 phosphoenolpyruvate synthase [Colwellia sp. BRX10-2]
MQENVLWYEVLGMNDVDRVGGKNASLGEMISNLSNVGVQVPGGFATTSYAFNEFLEQSGINDKIYQLLDNLDVDDLAALSKSGETIRNWIIETPFLPEMQQDIAKAYTTLADGFADDASFAVRSSATAEDMPDASFAGQQETFLNVRGFDAVMIAIKHVYASLFNDRAISYRVHQGYDHRGVALSAGIQRMVRSDIASSGVMFSIDTESGFEDVVFITSSYGLGEMVVQGAVNPDEFYVHKPTLAKGRPSVVRRNIGSKAIKMIYTTDQSHGKQVEIVDIEEKLSNQFSLTDDEVQELAKQAVIIEKHYQRPMDIEWAKDGLDGKLYIVQARPETVRSRESANVMEQFQLQTTADVICEGRSIGHKIGSGEAKVLASLAEMDKIKPGDVLVTDMTDPDWEPIMKRASAIVTNRGGRTCHAAIIAREMGIPAVVGCGDATKRIANGDDITVSCAEGDTGFIYKGKLDFTVTTSQVDSMPEVPLKIMMNVGNPDRAFGFARLPHAGIGLARLEFIINKMIGIHPKALLNFDEQSDDLKDEINDIIVGYASPVEFYIAKLTEGIATLASAYSPEKVIVRMSDFKSNEYANLVGGDVFEPEEENPMIGYRGAARYISKDFRECFALECEAIKRVRNDMDFTNVEIMIPFVRTVEEAEQVIEILAENGLKRGENGLRVIMMCELPSNCLLADQFLDHFDGFSIGSNDLTQLTLGLDRDSGLIAHLFDERNPAIKALLSMAIKACKARGKYVGICGQGPSDHPDFAAWLVEEGIDSVSLNPDTVLATWLYIAENHKNK